MNRPGVRQSCHLCGASYKRRTTAMRNHVCGRCGTSWHAEDCGGRYVRYNKIRSLCPRCYRICGCSGGNVACHCVNASHVRARLLKTCNNVEEPEGGLHNTASSYELEAIARLMCSGKVVTNSSAKGFRSQSKKTRGKVAVHR